MTQQNELAIAREVAASVLENHAAVADEVVRAVTNGVPQYSPLKESDTLLADIREHCDAHVQGFLSGFLNSVPPEKLDIAFAEDAVRRRVQEGIPLEPVLHSFRIGHQVLWQSVLRQDDLVEGGRAAVVVLVDPSIHYIDAMSTLVAGVYMREQQRALTLADRLRRDVLELLLTDTAAGLQAARSAGIPLDLDATYTVLTATSGVAEEPHVLQIVEEAIGSVFATDLVLAVARHHGVTALLRGDGMGSTEGAEEAVRLSAAQGATSTAIGIGLPAGSLREIGRAHEQATIARDLATNARPVVALADMVVTDYLIARADGAAQSMIPEPVRALAQSQRASERELVRTLRIYLATGLNVQQTAAMLPAHPNTVRDRLRRLAEKTGYSTHDAEELARLLIELRVAAHS